MMSNKIEVGVLFGGQSEEHIVSVMSAKFVMKHLSKERYHIVPFGICRNGTWVYLESVEKEINENRIEELQLDALLKECTETSSKEAINHLMECVDIVFPVLHGPYGEDGTIQGMLEILGIPYVGADVPSSAVCMDKLFTKQIAAAVGVPVVPSITLLKHDYYNNYSDQMKDIETRFEYPLFVKPASLGSSVGVSKVSQKEGLKEALEEAFKYDTKLLIEIGVNCRELECAVLGNTVAEASPIGEILPSHDFYDFEAKYLDDGKSEIVIPANITAQQSETLRELSLKIYSAIGITGLSRIDFFIDKDSGEIYLNEINTLPGFTKYSMYPLLWLEVGLGHEALLDRLIELGFNRKED